MNSDSKDWISLAHEPFKMSIDNIFAIPGQGTVAEGLIESGIIKTGEQVDIVGTDSEKLTTDVTGLEMFRKVISEGRAGARVGLILRGIRRDEIGLGMIIRKPQ